MKSENFLDGKKIISLLFHNHKSVKYYIHWLSTLRHFLSQNKLPEYETQKSWLFNLNFRENKVQNRDQIWKYVYLDFTIYTAFYFPHEKHQRLKRGVAIRTKRDIKLNMYPQIFLTNFNKSFRLEFLGVFRIDSLDKY